MRFKIEMQYGYISLDEKDEDKAWDIYKESGVRMFLCDSIFDEGILIAGPPQVVDLTEKEVDPSNQN